MCVRYIVFVWIRIHILLAVRCMYWKVIAATYLFVMNDSVHLLSSKIVVSKGPTMHNNYQVVKTDLLEDYACPPCQYLLQLQPLGKKRL